VVESVLPADTEAVAGPDRYRWTILVAGCFAVAVGGALLAAPPALAPTIKIQFDLSLGQVAVVLASIQGGSAVTMLPWGIVADRVGERAMMPAGVAGAGAALAASAYARSEAFFVAALFVAGMFAASVNVTSGRAVMGWFEMRERGFALGLRQTSAMLGMAGGAAVLPTVAEALGLRAALLSLTGAALFAAVVTAVCIRASNEGGADLPAHAGRPLRSWRIWRITLGSALLIVPQLALLGFVVLFLHDERGFSATGAAYVLAGMAVCGALVRILSGLWSDRLGRRLVPLRRITVALTLALLATIAAMSGPDAVLVVSLVVAGTLSTAWNGLSYAAVAEIAGRQRSGAAIGLQQTVLVLTGAITPIAFGAAVGALSWRGAFALLPLCPVFAYPFFLLRPRAPVASGGRP
jgi:MFS family permease